MKSRSCLMAGHRRRAGFTLIEIMVVVVIIALLAAIALPAIQKSLKNSQNFRLVNDLRIARGGFEEYQVENSGWPPDGGATFPTQVAPYLPPSFWTKSPPVGGNWSWGLGKYGVTASIDLTGITADDNQLLEIDAKCDDGNLSTGFLRKTGGALIYVMEF